jgi:signal transduction histidine kinase
LRRGRGEGQHVRDSRHLVRIGAQVDACGVRIEAQLRCRTRDGHHVVSSFEAATVRGDQTLLDNAVRYNHDGGELRVATSSTGDFAQVVVSNSGPLVAAEDMNGLPRSEGGLEVRVVLPSLG